MPRNEKAWAALQEWLAKRQGATQEQAEGIAAAPCGSCGQPKPPPRNAQEQMGREREMLGGE